MNVSANISNSRPNVTLCNVLFGPPIHLVSGVFGTWDYSETKGTIYCKDTMLQGRMALEKETKLIILERGLK